MDSTLSKRASRQDSMPSSSSSSRAHSGSILRSSSQSKHALPAADAHRGEPTPSDRKRPRSKKRRDARDSDTQGQSSFGVVSFFRNLAVDFCLGVFSTIRADKVILFFVCSSKIRQLSWKCLVLNGAIFLGSISMLYVVIEPVLTDLVPREDFWALRVFMDFVITTAWLAPLYLLSLVVGCGWYSEIARQAHIIKSTGRQTEESLTYERICELTAEVAYRTLLGISLYIEVFVSQVLLTLVLPAMLCQFLAFAHLAWFYAFSSFDYRWSLDNWNTERRIDEFETRAAFYFGFGAPVAALTFWFSTFLGGALYALFYPYFIIVAVCSSPSTTPAEDESLKPPTLSVFYIPQGLTRFLLWLFNSLCQGSNRR